MKGLTVAKDEQVERRRAKRTVGSDNVRAKFGSDYGR